MMCEDDGSWENDMQTRYVMRGDGERPAGMNSPRWSVPGFSLDALVVAEPLPAHLEEELAAWQANDQLKRMRREARAAAREKRLNISLPKTHQPVEEPQPLPIRCRGRTEVFTFRHAVPTYEVLREYRRLVTYPRQKMGNQVPLVLRRKPVQPSKPNPVPSRYKQAAEQAASNSKTTSLTVTTAPKIIQTNLKPVQLQPPRWDSWLARRSSQQRETAVLTSLEVTAQTFLPPIQNKEEDLQLDEKDSWESFKWEPRASAPRHLGASLPLLQNPLSVQPLQQPQQQQQQQLNPPRQQKRPLLGVPLSLVDVVKAIPPPPVMPGHRPRLLQSMKKVAKYVDAGRRGAAGLGLTSCLSVSAARARAERPAAYIRTPPRSPRTND